jgi:hypothetical protein
MIGPPKRLSSEFGSLASGGAESRPRVEVAFRWQAAMGPEIRVGACLASSGRRRQWPSAAVRGHD